MTRAVTVIKHSTMDVSLEKAAILTAIDALTQFDVEQDAARYIKETFDREHGPQWHCVVGKQFGCFVSHFRSDFTYFYVNAVAVLLYRTGMEADHQ
ncbi:Dynein light chain 1, cytoplasmic-like protein [Aphelenchoides fujianensis]|nr:Dynein light chain 1, cytoplasmic-like protein [Aphelenchoides fujianensis]